MLTTKPVTVEQSADQLLSLLRINWQEEMEDYLAYTALANKEPDANRRNVFRGIAATELHHASLWAARIKTFNVSSPTYVPTPKDNAGASSSSPDSIDSILKSLEQHELVALDRYKHQLISYENLPIKAILGEAIADESEHYKMLSALIRARPPLQDLTTIQAKQALKILLAARRKKHPEAARWLADSFYAANDGLAVIFGVISGVAGATLGDSRLVLLAGLTGLVASALSNGTGAYLDSRSEREVFRAGLERERLSVQEDEAEAREVLTLSYQSRGLPAPAASRLVHLLAENPELLIQALVRSLSNTTEEDLSVPWLSASYSGLATAFGAILPIFPFFFTSGVRAIILAAIVSLVAHFVLGAARALTTTRPWWSTALELTGIGAFQGATTYGLGVALGWMVARH